MNCAVTKQIIFGTAGESLCCHMQARDYVIVTWVSRGRHVTTRGCHMALHVTITCLVTCKHVTKPIFVGSSKFHLSTIFGTRPQSNISYKSYNYRCGLVLWHKSDVCTMSYYCAFFSWKLESWRCFERTEVLPCSHWVFLHTESSEKRNVNIYEYKGRHCIAAILFKSKTKYFEKFWLTLALVSDVRPAVPNFFWPSAPLFYMFF